jgi:hypothetical protein
LSESKDLLLIIDPKNDGTRATLRQLAATLAYRAAKVLREVPPTFATFRIAPNARTPVQVVAHLADLMEWATWLARGEHTWKAEGSDDWDHEIDRFFTLLAEVDALIAADEFKGSVEKLIQGPFADALTHVGQLSMMRGAAGLAVRPESYARAEIVAGRVGRDQAAPKAEFDGDASTRR